MAAWCLQACEKLPWSSGLELLAVQPLDGSLGLANCEKLTRSLGRDVASGSSPLSASEAALRIAAGVVRGSLGCAAA
eukprot:1907054-Lingulodinium_polyedra.AAC.1